MADSTKRSWARARRAVRVAGPLALAAGASCGGDEAAPGAVAIDLRNTPFPCRVEGYPCTWNEVPEAIVTRTKHLGDLAARMTLTMPSLDSVADFLAGREGMAEVVVDGTGVRYRLEGGRPAWVFLPGEMDHHRGTPATVAGSGPVPAPAGAAAWSARAAAAVGGWLGPRPLHASVLRQERRQEVAGEPGAGKKALVLSPYEFEFPGVGARFTSRARLVRDYASRNGGSVLFHADLDRHSDNPSDPAPGHRRGRLSPARSR